MGSILLSICSLHLCEAAEDSSLEYIVLFNTVKGFFYLVQNLFG